MPRYKLTIEYDGRPFAGWQRQADQPSVQAVLEHAAEKLNGAPVQVHGAGRTDSGVHATGQVAHIDLQKDLPADKAMDAINYHLKPNPVAVLKSEKVSDGFHARFSATERFYLYRISNRRPPLTLDAGFAWRVGPELDAEAMHAAAQALVGNHDFTTFRDSQCQADSPVRTLNAISVTRLGEEVHLRCRALSFLHRQVRSMVGSLVEVGRGKENTLWIGKILAAADRSACGPVAPPDGLHLTRVDY
ncbi:MAG: tRNA pseudouridine(38-40) synthase TruA [Ponticaulis sp.]|nr:tRNA pseudouridine(38-40) synthase TruA [Ponticaulis sp.]